MDEAVRAAHEFFEGHSGWAPPDADTLEEWAADGVSKAPDDCPTTVAGACPHGIASWHRVLAALDDEFPPRQTSEPA